MKFEDLKALGTEAECKAKGKYTQNGKNYLVQVKCFLPTAFLFPSAKPFALLSLECFLPFPPAPHCNALQDGDIFFFKFNVTTKGK